jgi:hypothetical protein
MFPRSLVTLGVNVCASEGSVTVTGLNSDSDSSLSSSSSYNIIVPESIFFPWLAATLGVTRIGRRAFQGTSIRSVTIPRRLQILCSECFSERKSLSSIWFETDSEMARAESDAFSACLSLKSQINHNS